MHTQTFQVMLQAKDPDLASHASIAAARLISLLPPGWGGRIDDLAQGTVLIIESAVPVPVDTAVAATASAMADVSLRDWEVGGCTPF
ncbi:hypothetical protein SK854_42485 [Lentzea sp. BCCO 10_0061]|uniref:Uncharacterized protein n=1 Tax=Lentzea sokolovensis TaxID=3095429 RepID=A0ABU4VCZ1_9PSEU|nr:hypothetical protein [Lentzea sp. BCCO 10_0061]MDX8148846.1 hypothetical protein [Lentzea sp. BCCO 10_0061]